MELAAKHQPSPIFATRIPAMAGPMTRAPLNIEEFSAMAFIRSSLPTMSTRKDWRPGMSKAFTTPSRAASTKMCQTWTRPVSVSAGQNAGEDHGSGLGGDHQALAIDAVGGNASERSYEEDRNLAGKADAAQQQGGFRHAVDEPGLGYGLHPGADERDELSAEEELKIAVAEGAQGCGPFRQARRFCKRVFSRGGIFLFSHSF